MVHGETETANSPTNPFGLRFWLLVAVVGLGLSLLALYAESKLSALVS